MQTTPEDSTSQNVASQVISEKSEDLCVSTLHLATANLFYCPMTNSGCSSFDPAAIFYQDPRNQVVVDHISG
ncbi:MAG: hypothetical protein CMH54_01175 [Myxococcales bacterium]|nr:hypothetical protein [Myxococcales bacterium]